MPGLRESLDDQIKDGTVELLSSTRRFRANPNYELVLYDRLPAEEQESFAELQKDPNSYGILRPG